MRYENYRQLDAAVDKLHEAQKYEQAIELLETARTQFPDSLDEILWYQALVFVVSGRNEKSLDVLEEMVNNGFFNTLEWNIFDPLRDDARFQVLSEKHRQLREAAQENAVMHYRVILPQDYTAEKQYPLLIALHGNGNWLDYFQYNWKPDVMLDRGFIVLYVQSSQVMSSHGYGWTVNYETSRRDIKAAFDAVLAQYAVDPHNVLVGGFSGGGMASIEVAMADTMPLKGFITLCASRKPDSFNLKNVQLSVQRGQRGFMMKGENEHNLTDEQEMRSVFDAEKFPYQYIVNPGIGHTFPADFDSKLQAAIDFVMG